MSGASLFSYGFAMSKKVSLSQGAAAPPLDRHSMYERSVQAPHVEIGLLERALKRAGHPALRLREDFSGTALLSANWIAKDRRRTAVAVDNDPSVHEWTRAFRLPGLGDHASRLRLVLGDVRRAPRGPFDAIMALNFSYQAFHQRAELKRYFASACRSLAPGGILMIDVCGGWLTQQGIIERRKIGGGVTYVWLQEGYDAITHRLRASIHFERKGKLLPESFKYEWRLWTLPELQDLLLESGFEDLEVFWDVEPPGVEPRYQPRKHAQCLGAWVAYVFARRGR